MTEKKMLLLFNPKAGKEEMRDNLFAVVDLFTSRGFRVTVHPTQHRGDAFDTVLKQGEEYCCLTCAGGDGTLSEIVGALMRLKGRRPVLGHIPCGTANDYATSLGLPRDILAAARNVCDGVPVAVDVGRFAGKHFSYVAAFGLFTDVSYGTPQDMKNLIGNVAYMLEGVKRLANITSRRCTIRLDDQEITQDFIFGMVANSTSIGGFRLPEDTGVLLGDGLFEVMLLKKITRFQELNKVIGALMGNGKPCDSILTCRTRHLHITSGEEIQWTLDGEYGGVYKKVVIRNLHKAVEVIVPTDSALALSTGQ